MYYGWVAIAKRVLLFGGRGQLGTEIRRRWGGVEIAAPSHAEVDITDGEAVAAAVQASGAQLVVNCAAFHNVERCEVEPQNAFAANTLAVNAMAESCARHGAAFLTVSTDYVFDGTLGRAYTEDDAPSPLSVYAASKYAGELLVQRLQSQAYVVRTCGVYGVTTSTTKGYTFIDRMIANARAGQELKVVNDQTVSPTYAGHLAKGLLRLLEADAPYGLYHMVNEGAVTWHEFASEALRAAGIEHPVEPVSHKTWPSKVRRPEYSALSNARLHSLCISLPDWRAGIRDYLADRANYASTSSAVVRQAHHDE